MALVPHGAGAAGAAAPDGYRMERYRAAVPDVPPPGVAMVDTAGVRALLDGADPPVLLDVMAVEIARKPAPVYLIPEPRTSLPGATWLPNVGYGELAAETEDFFRRHLERLTDGRRDRPLVFFCIVDCWMSWNAARRAVDWGYGAVHWYPGGTDDWAAAGLTLEPICPEPLWPEAVPACGGER